MIKHKIIFSTVIVFIIVLGVFFTLIFSFDHRVVSSAEKTLNTELEHKDYATLKKQSSNQRTFNVLKSQKEIKIHSDTDNQGSGNLAYYPVKINNIGYFGLSAKFNNIAFPNPKIKEIVWYQKD